MLINQDTLIIPKMHSSLLATREGGCLKAEDPYQTESLTESKSIFRQMLGLSLNALRDGLIGAAGHVVAMPVSRGFESGVSQISSGLKSVVISIFS
jgi:hypothetical protein